MNIKKRFKLRPIIVGTWVYVAQHYGPIARGDYVRISGNVYRVVGTRYCGIKLADRKK